MTNPSDIPPDVARKLLAIKEALLVPEGIDEAYHQLYSIADPEFSSVTPWAALEKRAALDSK